MKAVVRSRTLRMAATLKPPAALILSYHSVREDPEDDSWIGPGLTHSTQVFTRHMTLIRRHFCPISVAEIGRLLKEGKPLPRRSVAVTFDDGFLDNVETAAPVLDRFGIGAAFYLTASLIATGEAPWYTRVRRAFMTTACPTWQTTGSTPQRSFKLPGEREAAMLAAFEFCSTLVGTRQREAVCRIEQQLEVDHVLPPRRLMMDWKEAKTLHKLGHIVGSHTLTHPNIAYVKDAGALQAELGGSKRMLEEQLGVPVHHFSYPHPALHPQWTESTVALTRQAGYLTAVTTTRGPVRNGADPLALKRINALRPEHQFLWNLERAFLRS